MRILLLHPNYHSGGAEIAGNWPPAWVAYLAGALRQQGYRDIRFIDAMTNDLSEEQIADILRAEKPELDKETAVAESVWRNAAKRDREKAFGGRRQRCRE